MIIKKLHIENFGKLSNIDINFNSSINEILKENGWGKTTLSIFIKSMFYGMSAKTRGSDYKSERTRYMPWNGGVYGGYIEYKIGEKVYRVTRTFGKTPESDSYELLDYENNSVEKIEQTTLGDRIFGLGEESFKMTAFFPQLDFKSSSNSELTAYLTGVNKYKNDLSNIDKAIKKLNEKRLEIKRLIPKKSDIEEQRLKLNQIKNLKESLYLQMESEEKKSNELKKQNDFLEEKIKVEKEKYKIEEEKYKNKIELENKVNAFTSQINTLFSKQNEFQNMAIENLNSSAQKSSANKILIYTLPILLLIVISTVILFTLKVLNLASFISIVLICIVLFAVFITIYYKRYKNNSNMDYGTNISNEFKEKIDLLNNDLTKLKEILKENYSQVYLPDRTKIEELLIEQSKISSEYLSIKNKILILKNNIDENINQEDYCSANIEKLKEDLQNLEEKYNLIEKTIKYLNEARDNVANRYVSSINSEFTEILNKFNIPSNRFIIDNQWEVKEKTSIGTKEFEYSSQGYQDIISFCQRLSLINKIFKKEKPFILLDDTFVNLDDNMLICAKEIVKELSNNFQIIYICCNSRCSLI